MGVVGIEKDMNILLTYAPILGRPWSTGCEGGKQGEGGVVGVGGFQLMIERIDQLWLYISCSKSSFFVPFGGPSGEHACIGFMCLLFYYTTFSF